LCPKRGQEANRKWHFKKVAFTKQTILKSFDVEHYVKKERKAVSR
jgi:hypothetical protein